MPEAGGWGRGSGCTCFGRAGCLCFLYLSGWWGADQRPRSPQGTQVSPRSLCASVTPRPPACHPLKLGEHLFAAVSPSYACVSLLFLFLPAGLRGKRGNGVHPRLRHVELVGQVLSLFTVTVPPAQARPESGDAIFTLTPHVLLAQRPGWSFPGPEKGPGGDPAGTLGRCPRDQ